jgi:hypothetical protein
MSVFSNALHTLRVWTGFADVAETHLTPSHGWLLPSPVEARLQHEAADASRDRRAAEKANVEL